MLVVEAKHEFVQVRATEEFIEWACPVCARRVRLRSDGTVQTIERGDQRVNHGSVSVGPTLSVGVSVLTTPAVADGKMVVH